MVHKLNLNELGGGNAGQHGVGRRLPSHLPAVSITHLQAWGAMLGDDQSVHLATVAALTYLQLTADTAAVITLFISVHPRVTGHRTRHLNTMATIATSLTSTLHAFRLVLQGLLNARVGASLPLRLSRKSPCPWVWWAHAPTSAVTHDAGDRESNRQQARQKATDDNKHIVALAHVRTALRQLHVHAEQSWRRGEVSAPVSYQNTKTKNSPKQTHTHTHTLATHQAHEKATRTQSGLHCPEAHPKGRPTTGAAPC